MTRPARVAVTIETLAVEGLSPLDAERAAAALQAELTSLTAARAEALAIHSGRARATVDAGRVGVSTGRADALGRRAARAAMSGILSGASPKGGAS